MTTGTSPLPAAARGDLDRSSMESHQEVLIVAATTRIRLRDLLREGPVIWVLALRDIKVKFKQSLLGPLWLIAQPLALLLAFVLGLANIAHIRSEGVPYGVFVLVGIAVWSYFQIAVSMGAASIISNHTLVRRTPCPRVAFPLASLLTNLPALIIPGLVAVVAAAALGDVTWRLVLLPIALAWLLALSAGISMALAGLSTRFRDVVSALPLLTQVGVFLSPVAYPIRQLPSPMRAVITANPLSGLMEFWRWVVLSIHQTDFLAMLVSIGLTPIVLYIGWRVFARTEVLMADIV